jgi:hypothetical protein
MNFQTQKLLPAVLMSISSISAISATAHTAMATSVNANQHTHAVPAVLINQPDTNVQAPEKLSSYERALAEKTDFPARRSCGDSETYSFSGGGGRVQADDSRADCFR